MHFRNTHCNEMRMAATYRLHPDRADCRSSMHTCLNKVMTDDAAYTSREPLHARCVTAACIGGTVQRCSWRRRRWCTDGNGEDEDFNWLVVWAHLSVCRLVLRLDDRSMTYLLGPSSLPYIKRPWLSRDRERGEGRAAHSGRLSARTIDKEFARFCASPGLQYVP